MALTCDQARARLAQIEDALFALALGQGVRTVRDGDRSVEFAASADDLRRERDRYQRLVDACDGVPCATNRHAFRVTPD